MTKDEAFNQKKKVFEDLGFEVSVFETSVLISHPKSFESQAYFDINTFLYSPNKYIIDEVVFSIVEAFNESRAGDAL